MVNAWRGPRRIAVVPVWNRLVEDPPAQDFRYKVARRVFYDPRGDFDDSLQHYIQAGSYGRAMIIGQVFPVVEADSADVVQAAIDSLPANHGYDHLVAVLHHSQGPDRGAWAWWNQSPQNGLTSWARVALFQDSGENFRQSVGIWAMETLHIATEFGDLYYAIPELGGYDVMASASSASHSCAYTKAQMGWLGWLWPAIVPLAELGTSEYVLHAIGLRQPPPPGRVTAVRIRSGSSTFWVEARLLVDEYERGKHGYGIPDTGVIVYEVAGAFDVRLRTELAMNVGDAFAEGRFSVTVTGEPTDGREISVRRTEDPRCNRLGSEIIRLRGELIETGRSDERPQLLKRLGQLRQQAIDLGCELA